MTSRIKLLLCGSLFVLAGCGQPICVLGLGDCNSMYANAPQNLVGGGLAMNPTLNGAPSNKVGMGQQLNLNLTGGYPPYNFTANPSGCGSVNASAPFMFTPQQVGQCTITVTDSTTPVNQTDPVLILVQSNPL